MLRLVQRRPRLKRQMLPRVQRLLDQCYECFHECLGGCDFGDQCGEQCNYCYHSSRNRNNPSIQCVNECYCGSWFSFNG